MNLIKSLSLLTIATTLSFAQTTMCFKQNHTDFTTLENAPLDGGLCSGKKSLNDMKKDGWSASDIKIDGNNYIYILKKDEQTISSIDMEAIEAKILKRLEQKEEDANKAAILEKKIKMSLSGKKMYIDKCQNCHGEKGEAFPGNSRAINQLNLFDFTTTIRDYNNGSGYDRGTAFQMIQWANAMDANDIKNVYQYLNAINQTEKKETPKN